MGVATGCGCKEVYRFPHTTPLVHFFKFTIWCAILILITNKNN